MGVKGAALATVIAQGVSTCFVIHYLIKPTSQLKLRLKNIRFERKLLLPCILLGTSPALMQLTENMVAISFNTSLQKYGGDIAVASMSILTSIMQFVMLLLPGLVQGAQPLLSYNLWSKKYLKGKENIPIITHMLFKWLISYLACLYADTAKCSFYFYGRCASDYLYRKKYADLSCNASYIWNTSRMSV